MVRHKGIGMNKPNKIKVPVVKEVRVKLKLRGVPQEPEPQPAPEPEVPVPPRDVTWLYDQDILDAQTMINITTTSGTATA